MAKPREELDGAAVDFLFQTKRLASTLHVRVILSESAVDYLGIVGQAESIGKHSLKGFSGVFTFFTPKGRIRRQASSYAIVQA
ncbi:MAG: hypothetical protein HY360_13500 [Verrucomicrobia bacterium]|nr:hypothetical protein [Verrucomicrobiota bacterium]